jgi:hypothetical protein
MHLRSGAGQKGGTSAQKRQDGEGRNIFKMTFSTDSLGNITVSKKDFEYIETETA